MSVRGAVADAARLKRLATACLLFTLCLSPLLGGGMVVATHVIGISQFAFWGVLALVLWQVQETLRRTLLSQFRYRTVLPGDAISYIGQAIGIFVLYHLGKLTIGTAFAVMAATSAAAAILQALQIGLARMRLSELNATVIDFWSFGRWSLCSNASTIATDFSFSWVLTFARGFSASAVFGVMGNLTKLCNPVMNAVPSVAVPGAARARVDGGLPAAWKATKRYYMLGAAVLSPYVLLLILWPELVMRILYGRGTPYVQYGIAARINIIALILGYMANGIATYLAAIEQTRYNFIASAINAVAVLVIGLPMTYFGGLYGTIWACIVCVSVRLVCNLIFLARVRRQPSSPPSAGFPVILPGPASDDTLATAEAIANFP